MKIKKILLYIYFIPFSIVLPQSFMMQGWYWDFPKTAEGHVWADSLKAKAAELSEAGFTHIWLPSLSRASSNRWSNGYDPRDLYDLGEFGQGATHFGTRTDVDELIAEFTGQGIKAVADVIYNHRDGGDPEDNPAVEGWIEGYNSTKVNNGDAPFPSDRFRNRIAIGGASSIGAGNYYIKIRSASGHSNFYGRKYKIYIWTDKKGWQNLPDGNEVEPNGGGDCSQGNNAITLGRNFWAFVDNPAVNGECGTDEFHLNLSTEDFNAGGDNLYIVLSNDGGYSDHYIGGLWYDNGVTGWNIQPDVKYQTYTNFNNLPSGQGGMNYMNFRPNGNPTSLSGDWDGMWFYYDYDQTYQNTKDVLYAWTKWLFTDVGIKGLRMDAVKHFPREFVGDLFDYMYDEGYLPEIAVGEFYDGNAALLKGWIDDVYYHMDADTKSHIAPQVFDFSLRSALEQASDAFGYDARNVFGASAVDATGLSGMNVITFANNHDFRDGEQPLTNNPELAYAYLLTNNQIGLPCVYYPDYYSSIREKIDTLLLIHKHYIYGASGRDYLSNYGTSYNPFFNTGGASTTLVYQIRNTPKSKDVIVAINYAGTPLDMWIGINNGNVSAGEKFGEMTGNSSQAELTVAGDFRVNIKVPARSYAVWVQNTAPGAGLPVELKFFEAEFAGNDVLLKWETATEVNNFGFEIEKLLVNEKWEKIGFVEGAGNSNTPKTYSFTDNYPNVSNSIRYRLKQIDLDGKFEYSKEIVVNIKDNSSLPEQFSLSQNYPNPFNPTTNISFSIPEAGVVSLKVYNMLGQEIEQIVNEYLPKGNYHVNFNSAGLPTGIYIYKMVSGSFVSVKKMTILK